MEIYKSVQKLAPHFQKSWHLSTHCTRSNVTLDKYRKRGSLFSINWDWAQATLLALVKFIQFI